MPLTDDLNDCYWLLFPRTCTLSMLYVNCVVCLLQSFVCIILCLEKNLPELMFFDIVHLPSAKQRICNCYILIVVCVMLPINFWTFRWIKRDPMAHDCKVVVHQTFCGCSETHCRYCVKILIQIFTDAAWRMKNNDVQFTVKVKSKGSRFI